MGKQTGFLEYTRQLPIFRSPGDRVKDWKEFHHHLPQSALQEQAARCMDCGVPFCHTGTILNGATSGCPLNNLIPDWNHLVYTGNWRQALELLHKTNNFPEFTGRVCPAPCEGSCVLGIGDDPVSIKSIECAIVDRGFEEGWIAARPPSTRTGKRVAIVGSGPAGLACADQLNKAGHSVTVFEKSDRIGGLLMYGIPNMKLDKKSVQRRVDLLEQEGIQFIVNTEIGNNYPAKDLLRDFDAVVLCGGASKPRDLNVEGRQLKGIHFAMDFLRANTKALLDLNSIDDSLSASGKDVIVVGGGDTGTDCVATAIRQGCRSLVQFEILPQLTPDRPNDNPWPQWPRVHRMDYGHHEALAIFGSDPRSYSIRTIAFEGDHNENVSAVQTVELRPIGTNGTRTVVDVAGSNRTWSAQLVLLAMGFLGPPSDSLITELELSLNERGTITVDQNKMTDVPGIFAAGDMERGQSLVVWAITDGRRAAEGVHKYLMSFSDDPA
jgi:glutamate synthase (NADPH/NADH) small chain